jgi:hypothetical protein
MHNNNKNWTINRQGVWTSYLIGAPVGLITILLVLALPVLLTGEGLLTMGIVFAYDIAIVGMICSFLIALGVAGHNATKDLQKQKPLLKTAFNYALTVNGIIWSVFIVLTVANHFVSDIWILLLPPIAAFSICTILTTFTLGLLICYIIKRNVTRYK